ncbi:MAG: hypothetical protein JF607_26640 [Burkholderiales bacterium]|nr:hypothetical protein [Burkholderiales bacterium]
MTMRAIACPAALLLAMAGCAASAPKPTDPSAAHAGHGAPADTATAGKGGGAMGMMEEMCKKHTAAEPDRAASEPDMMAKHCKAKADAAGHAASAAR